MWWRWYWPLLLALERPQPVYMPRSMPGQSWLQGPWLTTLRSQYFLQEVSSSSQEFLHSQVSWALTSHLALISPVSFPIWAADLRPPGPGTVPAPLSVAGEHRANHRQAAAAGLEDGLPGRLRERPGGGWQWGGVTPGVASADSVVASGVVVVVVTVAQHHQSSQQQHDTRACYHSHRYYVSLEIALIWLPIKLERTPHWWSSLVGYDQLSSLISSATLNQNLRDISSNIWSEMYLDGLTTKKSGRMQRKENLDAWVPEIWAAIGVVRSSR